MSIKLNPLRQYSEHDVINFFSLDTSSGDEGQFVKIKGSGWVGNGDASLYRDISLTSEANIVSNRRVLIPEVKLAASGDDKGDVLGILLMNVRATDYLGRDLLWDSRRKDEKSAVLSGEAVPVCRRGMFMVSGIEGTGKVGSGIAVSDNGSGGWRVFSPAVETGTQSLGQFLGEANSQGFALVLIDC